MSGQRRWVVLGMMAAVVGGVMAARLVGEDKVAATGPAGLVVSAPATAPATAAATEKAGATTKRSMEVIQAEFAATSMELRKLLPSLESMGDAKFRKENGEKIIPVARKLARLLNEVAVTTGDTDAADARLQILGMSVAMGDKESEKMLKEVAAGKDAAAALAANSSLALASWMSTSGDAAAQQKVLDEFTVFAKANAKEDGVAQTLMIMSQLGGANEEMSKKPIEVIRSTMTGPAAKQIVAEADAEKAKAEMVGKPLTIEGRTTTDGKLSTGSLTGKVVLIDFWATWCGPCRAELPRVKKLYADYHEKGLEIVGVDCDNTDDVVTKFTKDNEMPWTQLREKSQAGQDKWHPLATKYGVDGIPTMFLIDKNGVLRYIDAREGTEEKVKKLLEEAAKMPAATGPAKK